MSLRPQGSRRVRKGLGPFPRKRARLQVEHGGEAITAWKYPSRARLRIRLTNSSLVRSCFGLITASMDQTSTS
eukprot:1066555-Pyramimonas_sp.AAC.1